MVSHLKVQALGKINDLCDPRVDYKLCGDYDLKEKQEEILECVCAQWNSTKEWKENEPQCKLKSTGLFCKRENDICIVGDNKSCEDAIPYISGDFDCKITMDGGNVEDFSDNMLNGAKCEEIKGLNVCNQIPSHDRNARDKCNECMYHQGNDEPVGVWTAIGCVSVDPIKAVKSLTQVGLGLGGLFTLLQIIYGAYELTFSRGETKLVSQAKKRITDSISALLFIIFAIAILRFFGVDILKIPGFG